jgi:hypothetical protein
MQSADAVFYNGHSRDGGGPDFSPPRLGPGKHPDYNWYKENRKGLAEMTSALSQAKAGPKIIGMFSCASNLLFSKRILGAKKNLGLISNEKLLYYSDALQNSLDALSALLAMKCQHDFEAVLSAHSKPAGSHLLGFF